MSGEWKAVRVPINENDDASVRPMMEGTKSRVMDEYSRWRNGNNETPLGNSRSIVITDEKGHLKHAASR